MCPGSRGNRRLLKIDQERAAQRHFPAPTIWPSLGRKRGKGVGGRGAGGGGAACGWAPPEPSRRPAPLPARFALPLLWTLMTGLPRQGHCHAGNEAGAAQRGEAAGPRPHSWQTAELSGSESRMEARGSLPTPEPTRSLLPVGSISA